MKNEKAYRILGFLLWTAMFFALSAVIQRNLQQIASAQARERWEEIQRERRSLQGETEQAGADEQPKAPDARRVRVAKKSASPRRAPTAKPDVARREASPPPPAGFRRVEDREYGVAFSVPASWSQKERKDDQGDSYIMLQSPDGEVSVSLLCKADYDNAFAATTERTIRAFGQKGYVITSVQGTKVGGEDCTRWVYRRDGTMSINRVFRHGVWGYSLLYRLPESKFSKWEATLDEIRMSFRFIKMEHGE